MLTIVVWLFMLAITCDVAQPAMAQCGATARVAHQTQVFAQPASSFNLSSGWVYGQPLAVLSPGVAVRRCSDRKVSFGLVSQQWSQIAFWSSGHWAYGWVVADSLQAAQAAASDLTALLWQALPLGSAQAQPVQVTESAPNSAVAPLPPGSTQHRGLTPPPDRAWDPALSQFYAILFVFMVLGMLGKVAFDALLGAARVGWKVRARACALPLVVSPIAFLGLLQASDASATASVGSFVAIVCTAFQSGFFWHTVFGSVGRDADRPGAPSPLPRGSARTEQLAGTGAGG